MAVWFRELLEETGCEIMDVNGVILYPVLEVDESRPYSPDWVRSPKVMPKRIKEEKDRRNDEEVKICKKFSLWMRDFLDASVQN